MVYSGHGSTVLSLQTDLSDVYIHSNVTFERVGTCNNWVHVLDYVLTMPTKYNIELQCISAKYEITKFVPQEQQGFRFLL